MFAVYERASLILAHQGVDQPLAVGAAPSRYQIVAGHGRIAARLAAGDVVEVRAVARTHAKGIQIRVDESDGRKAVGF
ncbi:MAG: ParB N-terminal domain-containing protein [Candidatus Sulfotelmatobacter sp.]